MKEDNQYLGILPDRYRDAVGAYLMDAYGYSSGELRLCREKHARLMERARCAGVSVALLADQIAQLDAGQGR